MAAPPGCRRLREKLPQCGFLLSQCPQSGLPRHCGGRGQAGAHHYLQRCSQIASKRGAEPLALPPRSLLGPILQFGLFFFHGGGGFCHAK